ncbi:hypothetical protein [Chitinophaga nivalis]|uniref:Lipocalin-like domain-containing protein n=1 Tax=Chitinophaga nivalis TaxID=2991709 RepID=A0ABT3IT46_9BACT|nr:hypothetical protein [Chitinophaga nivalis]MCW3463158.1 hypothetical protein [Chitinophaga nivalis]MCW3487152.1 hypothetical protein [Chitinophaga nivalis]
MKFLIFLYFMIPLNLHYKEKQYSHRDIICTYSYTVTKEWNLLLKEQGTFSLMFRKKDNQYGKLVENKTDFLGTWENKNDTIILTVSAPLPNDYDFKNTKYILSKDTLKSLANNNICLPAILEPGRLSIVF